jgi:trigger factor
MNITRENSNELNAVLKLEFTKEDYTDRVSAVLKDYRKKANIPGFRPGKVPIGMINKMYGKPVLVEEINKLVSESLSKYLADEKLNILGEPLPHEGENKPLDFDTDEEFEFKFDVGIAPEIDITPSTKDKIPYYTIKVDADLLAKYEDNYTQRGGEFIQVDTIEDKDVLSVKIVQLNEKDEVLEAGIFVEEARMATDIIKDEAIKKAVLKAKKGDELVMDLKKAFPNDTEIASLLKVKTEEAATISGNFKVSILEIQRFQKAEVNQELFDKLYGEGVINSVEEFREKIAAEAAEGLKRDSDFKFRLDVKETLVKKFKKELPEAFLKRWLIAANEGKFTLEEIEKDFDKFTEDLKWQLIKDKLMKENGIEVNENDLRAAAIENARTQFAYYGMNNVPDEHLEQFAQRTFENKEELRKLHEEKVEEKVISFIKETVKVDNKEITAEKFNKFFEDKK